MTEEQAIEHLRAMMYCAQKTRSNILESWGVESEDDDPITKQVLSGMEPWLFGPSNILIGLDKVLTRVDRGGHLEPMEFYNFMLVADRSTLLSAASFMFQSHMVVPGRGSLPLPKPDLKLVAEGWADANEN